MKWLTYKTWDVKVRELETWHIWFAWFPVTLEVLRDGVRRKVWLEKVLRCGTNDHSFGDSWWYWTYKGLKKENTNEKRKKS